MKKFALLLLAFWIGVLCAEANTSVSQTANQAFRIISKSANSLDVRFNVPEYEYWEETVGNKTFQHIRMDGASYLVEQGMPELPVLATTLIVPTTGSVNVEALSMRERSLGSFLPYPVQESISLTEPRGFVLNESFYAGNSIYPEGSINYSDPAILRDFRVISVQINPFYYNAQTGELNVRESIEFRVSSSGSGINELVSEPTDISPAWDRLYSSTILNYADYRDQVNMHKPPRYLLIYGNNTDPAFVTALDAFVLWKKQKGADLRVVSTAVAGTSNSAIKTYIQGIYNDPTTRPDFIILLGDTEGSYSIPGHTVSSGGGDYPYTHLAGTDGIGDVFIGRISVENLSQLQVVLNKIYLYERDMDLAAAETWMNKILLAADWTPSGISTVYMAKYMMEVSQEVNPEYTYIEVYGSESLGTGINAGLNQGVGFFNFRGYIDLAGWSPSESLFNGFKLPHTLIITCGTGNYLGGLGKTEQFIRLGTVAAPKGAVTSIGMSTSSTHTTFNNAINGGIIHGLFQAGMRTMGEALLAGKLNMHQIFGVSSPSNVTSFNHWCNLMGDPTMEVFVGVPNEFTVNLETTIPLGLSLLDIAVSGPDGVVADASVTLSQGNQVISRGYTDAEGNIILVLPAGMTAGSAVVTVHKHNYKPKQITIAVTEQVTLVPGELLLDDDNFGGSNGNDNDIANAGETLELSFGLQNTGTSPINGISGYITSNSPYVTITDSLVTYGNIAGSSLGFAANPTVVNVSGQTPHGTMLRLYLHLTDNNGNNYVVSEFVPVESPKFNYNSNNIVDGGNLALDPNETASMNIGITNIGPVPITELYGRLYSLNDLVMINDNIGYFGNVEAGASVNTTTDNFSVYAREQILPGMVIPMQLKLYNAAGYEQYLDFSITISVVTVQDPLGPCEYGYVIYDDQDWNYEHRPTFEWVGIAPAEGGLGTLVPLSDAYTSGDEGDQVGATSIATVDLPFPFQFYGVMYEEVSIASNGFIALGTSANGEFRNFRLPGPMGPSPMIAPFWDDLATHTGGGVYTWFDRNNHAFVVEWYNMKNGKNGTSLETFQAILYDQSIYATSMGDGPIKFQYLTFNNVDSQSGANHGNFASIGIEDHTGTRGLEYTFNNVYPTAASPLGNQRALYITNVPVYHMEAQLIVAETYVQDTNDNNIAEPGERVNLGVQLNNIGNAPASEITAILTCEDEYINIINGESAYYPLDSEQTGVNRTAFVFDVAEDCPDGRVINFNLNITAGEIEWQRPFSIRIDASMLTLHSTIINDDAANYNGVVDIGETIKLVVNIKNPTTVEARDVVGVLSSEFTGVNILNPTINRETIASNHIMQFVYDLTFTGETGAGTYIPFTFTSTSSNALPMETELYVPYNITNEFNDLEQTNADFISEIGWTWGHPNQVTPYSGAKVWATNLSGGYPDLIDYKMYSPTYLLTENSTFNFKHYFAAEAGYDGGNISISTDGGANWTLLTPQGGYTHNNISGLAGQPGFSGNSSTWQNVIIPLSQYTGQNVIFRFRFGSDGATGNHGWFIDDINLSGVDKKTGKLYGIVIPTSDFSPSLATVIASNNFATHPDDQGNFKLYMKNGTYYADSYMKHHQSASFGPFSITAQNPQRYTEFTLIYLPKPFSTDFTVNNDTGEVVISWTEPYDPVLPVVSYKVYKRFDTGPFVFVNETTETSYTETVTLDGLYQYFVRVKYINVEGSPSDTISFTFPYDPSDSDSEIPGLVTGLRGNYPNPFNPTTTISYDLQSSGPARLVIFNMRGQVVKTLVNTDKSAGRHHVIWDGRDEYNRPVSSGVYFYKLDAGTVTQTKKMLLMK